MYKFLRVAIPALLIVKVIEVCASVIAYIVYTLFMLLRIALSMYASQMTTDVVVNIVIFLFIF